jgi:WD40 repeat protein
LIAAGDNEGVVRIWDASDGRQVSELPVYPGGTASIRDDFIAHVAFIHDGRLVFAGKGHDAELWDPARGAIVRELHHGQVRALAAAPEQPLVAIGDAISFELQFLDGDAPLRSPTLSGVRELVFSPDGAWLAVLTTDGVICTYKAPGRADHALAPLGLIRSTAELNNMAVSPDGRLITAASLDGTTRIWSSGSGALLHVLPGPDLPITHARFSPDGTRVLTVGDDKLGRVWRLDQGLALRDLASDDAGRSLGEVHRAQFFADGLIVIYGDGSARAWDPEAGRLKARFAAPADFEPDPLLPEVALPDGKLVTSNVDGVLQLWSPSGALLRSTHVIDRTVMDGMVSSDGDPMFLYGAPYSSLWNMQTFEEIAKLWSAGEPETTPSDAAQVPTAGAMSPDGMLVGIVVDGTLRLWDGRTGAPHGAVRTGASRVSGLAFSPDHRWAATTADDGTVNVWSTVFLVQIAQLAAGSGEHLAIDFLSDRRLAVASNNLVHVFDIESATLVLTLREPGTVRRIVESPDGKRLVVVADGAAHLYDLDDAALAAAACAQIATMSEAGVALDERREVERGCEALRKAHP